MNKRQIEIIFKNPKQYSNLKEEYEREKLKLVKLETARHTERRSP